MAVIEATDLVKHFSARRSAFGGRHGLVRAVDGVSFTIEAGQTLGIVGESGCGKTTTAKLVLGLEEPTGGSIRFAGRELRQLDAAGRRHYRKSVQAVFQDPYASLNPRLRIGATIAEPLITNEKVAANRVRDRVGELLDLVGLPADAADLFPHEFSGGQRQRIAIARALALSPRLVVLDEPVSALDVSIRAQILNLLRDLQARLGLSYLFIAHDLAAVAHMSHAIAVMYLGKIVEQGEARSLARAPQHPYTQALFSAALPIRPDERRAEIDLLLSDLVMPQMSGRRLAEAVRRRHPDVRVLYMSGYDRERALQQGEPVGVDAPVLQKPFSVEELAWKVREALVRTASERRAGA